MNSKVIWFVISAFIVSSEAQRRRIATNCWWYQNEERLYCILARLDAFLRNLEVPGSAKVVVCTHSAISNATRFKTQVLDRTDELEVLRLSYNKLRSLPGNFLETNPMLTEINLRNNQLATIPANLFQHQARLEKLDLSNNRLTAISETTFRANVRLRVLELWNNELATLPEDIFRKQANLEKLSLTNNKLQSLRRELFWSTGALKELIAVRNNLQCLPVHVFDGLLNVESINLGYNELRLLPDGLFSRTAKLRKIRLWANQIDCIPSTLFDNTTNLVFANFLFGNTGMAWELRQRFSTRQSYNTINTLREKLVELGNETCASPLCDWDPETATLDCSYRNLTCADEIDDVCGEARHLKLNGNKLNDSNEIAALLKKHPRIRTLELQNNLFEGELSANMLEEAKFLSFVDLSSNNIDDLPPDFFQNNLLLQEVRIQRNGMRKIHERLFKENDAIEKIDLSSNRISELTEETFARNSALQDIDLSLNTIQQMDKKVFEKNVKLRSVDLSRNELRGRVDLSSLRHALHLARLLLQGNQLREVAYGFNLNTSWEQTREVSLSTNRLLQLPLELLRSAPMAEKFDFQRNEIANLPEDAFSNNIHILSIDLSNNRLHSLSTESFKQNPNLQLLILDGNSLTEIPAQLLHSNRDLRVFSAAGNRLRSIPVDLFWKNPNLEEVHLSNNQLGRTGLPGNLFAGSPRLTFVSLGGNSLTRLPEALFQGTPRLTQVYLQKNKLESINQNTFQVRQGLSDQSLLSILKNVEETDNEELEELLDENLEQSRHQQALLSRIIKLDLRENPSLDGTGVGELFTDSHVTKFFNKLPRS